MTTGPRRLAVADFFRIGGISCTGVLRQGRSDEGAELRAVRLIKPNNRAFGPPLRDDLGIVLDKARSHPRLAMVLSGTHRADD